MMTTFGQGSDMIKRWKAGRRPCAAHLNPTVRTTTIYRHWCGVLDMRQRQFQNPALISFRTTYFGMLLMISRVVRSRQKMVSTRSYEDFIFPAILNMRGLNVVLILVVPCGH
jgi:hypothetical protein